MRLKAILVLSAVLLVACSGGATTSAPLAISSASSAAPPGATASTVASSAAASAASSLAAKVIVGGDRPVTVQVPPGYDPAHPAPLLILLHGYGSSGLDHESYFRLRDEAARRGYLYVYPNGTLDHDRSRFWNATDACCDFEKAGVDDTAYLAGVIAEIEGKFSVDPKRIDVIGHSNGAFMSYALACAHAETVAAIVSLAGATFVKPTDCAPTGPVAVVEVHGTADDTILYDGGTLDLGPGRSMAPYPGAVATVATWAKYDGCATSSDVDEHIDVDSHITVDGAKAETSVKRWTGCRPGGAVELWTIPGGGHAPTISDAFPAAVLDFFEAHPKP